MRTKLVLLGLAAGSLFASVCAVSQSPAGPTYQTNNRELSYRSDGVVHLNAGSDDGVAWLDGPHIADGRISLDVKGADLQGRSFVGVAFRGTDDQHYDVVYLRPFNFNAAEQERRAHSLQYVSLPEFGWERLRKEFPGKYEAEVHPSPHADAWVHLELELKGEELRVFVDGAKQPALQIKLLSRHSKGTIGLWVGNNSDGDFRRLELKAR